MSAAILSLQSKPHSLRDDLQSVFWVALENAINNLQHGYHDIPRVAMCFLEYNSFMESGGNIKFKFLSDAPPIEFVKNPAFSALLRDFCEMVFSSDRWETKLAQLKDPSMAGPQPTEVQDHDGVLKRFRKALDCPDDQWLLEPCDKKNQLRQAMADAERVVVRGSMKSRTSTG